MQPPAPHSGPPRIGRKPIRVMIVDDSLVARTVLSRIIEAEPDCEIVAKATTGEMAIARLGETPADVILLDLEMPGMGGIGALPKILSLAQGGKVLVVSSLTAEGAEHTLKALSMGAADTLLKPRAGEFDAEYARALMAKIRALAGSPAAARDMVRPAAKAPVRRAVVEEPQVLAIGDAPNDVGMLKYAGVAVAMDNAAPVVKKVAHWVAPSNDDHGVHAALVRYGLCG